MKKRKRLAFILILLITVLLAACDPIPEPTPDSGKETELNESVVQFSAHSEGVAEYAGMEIYLEESRLPLYGVQVNTSQVWTGSDYKRETHGVGLFNLDGKVNVTVKLPFPIDYSSQLLPESAKIIPVADIRNNTLTFLLKSTGNYVLKVYDTQAGDYKIVYLFVTSPTDYDPSVLTGNVIYFGKGLHTAETSDLIASNHSVTIPSDTVVYLDKGAVVRAKFLSNDTRNIAIMGEGVIDGSVFERNASTGRVTVPVDLNRCTDVMLRGFTVLDPAGWCINAYYLKNLQIDNIKIISSRSNGDGISLQSCQDAVVKNCFIRSWDDSLVVKNYPQWSDRSKQGTTKNILFEHCTLWTDLAQSMEIGYETVGTVMEDITFRNITVLEARHKPVISIHNGNNAEIKRVLYENITVEYAAMGQGDAGNNDQLIEISVAHNSTWSDQHAVTALGGIDGVTVRNVLVKRIRSKLYGIVISGCYDGRDGSVHHVKNVRIENVTIKDTKVTDAYAYLTKNMYTSGITVVHDGNTPSGAAFLFSKTASELESYQNIAKIYVV